MRKKIVSILLGVTMVMAIFAGCSSSSPQKEPGKEQEKEQGSEFGTVQEKEEGKTYQLTVAANNAMVYNTVNRICMDKGWFEDAGLDVELIQFESGPVCMEAIDSWDIALTGIGGILVGALSYDTPTIAAINLDCATHYLWARKDSPIVAAGTGNNTHGENVYGTADAWRDAEVLCPNGNTLSYLLAKTLDGFGLTADDVNWVAMDAPSSNTAFIGGEGDVAATWSGLSFTEDKEDYVPVSNGLDVQTNVICTIVANPERYQDEETRAAIKIYLSVFEDCIAWIQDNYDEAGQYLSDLFADDGQPTEAETGTYILSHDTGFTLEDNYEMMNTMSDSGECNLVEECSLNVLKYYVSVGIYEESDIEKFIGHTDATLINEIYEERNQ